MRIIHLRCVPCFSPNAQALKIDFVPDVNGGRQEGVSLVQSTTYKGRRCSAVRAFIDPIREDWRLTLKCEALVTRILFEGSQAVGVEYVEGERRTLEKAFANNEVVLSAGAYATPKLLCFRVSVQPSSFRNTLSGSGRICRKSVKPCRTIIPFRWSLHQRGLWLFR